MTNLCSVPRVSLRRAVPAKGASVLAVLAWGVGALLVLAAPGCSKEQGEAAFCHGDGDCPAGARCVGGQCLPGEYQPLPQADLGPADDAAADAGEPDSGEPDGGPEDAAVDAGEDGGEDLGGGQIVPLELTWLEPGGGSRVEGEIELRFALRADLRLRPRLLTVTVDDVEAARLGRPDPQADVVVRLDTAAFPDGARRLAATILDDGGRTAESGPRFLIFLNHPQRLQLEQGRFFLGGEQVGLVGVEYTVPDDDAVLDADLAAMAAAGINLISTAAPAVEVEPAENTFTPEGCSAVSRLLDRAPAQGSSVLLVLPPYRAWPWLQPADPAAGAAAPLWDGKLRSALARRHANLLERCGWVGRDALAAVDVWRSPRPGSESERASSAAIQAWDAWSLARHGSAEARAAAWGAAATFTCGPAGDQPCPPPGEALCDPTAGGEAGPSAWVADYRAFTADAGRAALQDLAAKVKLAAPSLLIAAGLDAPAAGPIEDSRLACAQDGGTLDPRTLAAGLDFLLLVARPWQGVPHSPLDEAPLPPEHASHANDFFGLELSALWARGASRPIVLAGFAGDAALGGGGEAGEAVQAGVWSRVLRLSRDLALDGVVGASWRDDPAPDVPQTGLLAADGLPRAALAALQEEAAAVKTPAFWAPNAWLAVPAERVHHLAEAFYLAQPYYLPLRTEEKKVGTTGCSLPANLSCPEVAGCTELCPAPAAPPASP